MRLAILSAALASAAFMSFPTSAAESVDSCTTIIGSGPVSITEPGVYCLAADYLHPEDYGIAITVPDVVFDCRGHAIGRNGNADGLGIWGAYEATNVVVRNCEVRGYGFGILLYGGGVIEDNLVRNASVRGIYVEGDGAIIRRNRVYDTGAAAENTSYAISAFGDIDIVDNVVDGVVVGGPDPQRIIGILANDGLTPEQTFVIRGNVVRNLRPEGVQEVNAIWVGSSGKLDIRDNVLFGPDTSLSSGISCFFGADTRVSGNDLYDFATALAGCGDDSGNVVKP